MAAALILFSDTSKDQQDDFSLSHRWVRSNVEVSERDQVQSLNNCLLFPLFEPIWSLKWNSQLHVQVY